MAQKVSHEGLTLDAELINPFIRAIRDVLQKETHSKVLRTSKPTLTKGGALAHEITSVIGLIGEISGVFLISVSAEYAFSFFREVVGVEATEIDEVVLSGIAELSNTIAGQAAIALEEIGLSVDISPPLLIKGNGASLSTLDLPRVSVPLKTDLGDLVMEVAVIRSAV
jgi:chemotaxis protein CheX